MKKRLLVGVVAIIALLVSCSVIGGSAGAKVLEGTWEGDGIMGSFTWSFTGNKFTQDMMGIKTTVPCKIKGNSISYEAEGVEVEIPFEVNGDILTVDFMGYELEFERVE